MLKSENIISNFKNSAILTICCHCQKIKKHHLWFSAKAGNLPKFKGHHSHGICPGCLNKYYAEYIEKNKES